MSMITGQYISIYNSLATVQIQITDLFYSYVLSTILLFSFPTVDTQGILTTNTESKIENQEKSGNKPDRMEGQNS